MSLKKAIKYGKEHRKQYRGAKSVDPMCRNHKGCDWCKGNRTYQSAKQKQKTDESLKDIDLGYVQVEDLLTRLELSDSLHNNCDYLLEHSEIDLLLDYINKLEREIKIKDAWANEIKCNLWGYDGYENSINGLKGLVDEAIDKSEKIMNCDDKSIVMSGLRYDKNGNEYVEYKNVLDEVLTEFTEKDQRIIDLCNKDLRGDNDE